GVLKASGNYIGFINADDFYNKDVLCQVIKVMKENKYDVIYGNMSLVEADSLDVIQVRRPKDWKLHIDMNLSHPATFIKKDIHRENLFNTSYKIASDYDLLLKLKKQGYIFHYIDKNISSMRNAGLSAKNVKLALEEARQIRKKRNGKLYAALADIYLFMRKVIKR
ncbi:glycosyltransferase, partial [Escherichia coli]|nr:glycosyltransferase [Escherichia coli]